VKVVVGKDGYGCLTDKAKSVMSEAVDSVERELVVEDFEVEVRGREPSRVGGYYNCDGHCVRFVDSVFRDILKGTEKLTKQ